MLKVAFLFTLADVVRGSEMQYVFYLENIFSVEISWTGQSFTVGSRTDVGDDEDDKKLK